MKSNIVVVWCYFKLKNVTEVLAINQRRFSYLKDFALLSIFIWKNGKAPRLSKRGRNFQYNFTLKSLSLLYVKETKKYVLAPVVKILVKKVSVPKKIIKNRNG